MLFKVLILTVFCLTLIQAAEDFEPTEEHLKSLWSLLPLNEDGKEPDFKDLLSKMSQEDKNKVRDYLLQLVPGDTERGEFKFTAIQRAQLRDLAIQLIPGNDNPFENGKKLTDEQAEKVMELLNTIMPLW